MKFRTIITLSLLNLSSLLYAGIVGDTLVVNIDAPQKGSFTKTFSSALDKARKKSGGRHIVFRLNPAQTYNLTRQNTIEKPYFISNTTAPWEAENENKHIGLLLKGVADITIDGQGAKILTHGEITPWVIDSCENISLKNFSIDAIDPSVPEMTVMSVTDSTLVAQVNSSSNYRIDAGKLFWVGNQWKFTDGIAQIYNPELGTSIRTDSPVATAKYVREVEPGIIEFSFTTTPNDAKPGCIYQMRHSLRTEAAGFIYQSKNVTLQNINFHFLGNFGIVSQTSSDITFSKVNFASDPQTGRINAGFADFLQVSSCSGLVKIDSCRFCGAHDDPINVHGTHLRIVKSLSPQKLLVRYMHPQTRGFQIFFPGDSIAITNSMTLLQCEKSVIETAQMLSDTDILLNLVHSIDTTGLASNQAVVENLTLCPSVSITNSSFTLTPTRAILVSTWRPVTIEHNTFIKCPMPAILIADDARSWFESGPVKNVIIKNNRFINCANPVIAILPENNIDKGYVHENIRITDNFFNTQATIVAKSVKNLKISGNKPSNPDVELR